MKNPEHWRPSKFVFKKSRLVASRDPQSVSVGSRLVTDRIASFYGRCLPKYANGRLIDLGCGTVPLYSAYRDYVTAVTCVDWGACLHATDHLDHICDLGEPLPFGNDAFDTVIVSDVVEHLYSPSDLFQEVRRILAPSGVLLLNTPFLYWVHEAPHDYYRYTEYALRRLTETSGLQVEELSVIGGSAEVFVDMLAKHAMAVPFLGRYISSVMQSAASLALNNRWGRRLAEGTGRHYPLGYSMVAKKASTSGS